MARSVAAKSCSTFWRRGTKQVPELGQGRGSARREGGQGGGQINNNDSGRNAGSDENALETKADGTSVSRFDQEEIDPPTGKENNPSILPSDESNQNTKQKQKGEECPEVQVDVTEKVGRKKHRGHARQASYMDTTIRVTSGEYTSVESIATHRGKTKPVGFEKNPRAQTQLKLPGNVMEGPGKKIMYRTRKNAGIRGDRRHGKPRETKVLRKPKTTTKRPRQSRKEGG